MINKDEVYRLMHCLFSLVFLRRFALCVSRDLCLQFFDISYYVIYTTLENYMSLEEDDIVTQ